MTEKQDKLEIRQLNKILKDSSVHSRRRELARRQARTWKTRLTEEELERMLQNEPFVDNLIKEYMRGELRELEKLVYDIDEETDQKEKAWKNETLIANLIDLLPDLMKTVE